MPKGFNLCAIDLPEGHGGYSSLSSLARRYAAEIRTFQPEGSYCVGGYSFGGNLAHELALELERQGCKVEAVVMFDSHPPQAYNAYAGGALDYVGAFPGLMASYFKPELLQATIDESRGVDTLEAAVELVRRRGILKETLKDDDVERFFDRWVFTHTLLKEHEPTGKADADLVIFVAKEEESTLLMGKLKIEVTPKSFWNQYFNGRVTPVDVDGDHFTIFSDSQNVRSLANRFFCVMQERDRARRGTLDRATTECSRQ
jgi:thioesterase domain-containing protein